MNGRENSLSFWEKQELPNQPLLEIGHYLGQMIMGSIGVAVQLRAEFAQLSG
jgi:hypothetical protein